MKVTKKELIKLVESVIDNKLNESEIDYGKTKKILRLLSIFKPQKDTVNNDYIDAVSNEIGIDLNGSEIVYISDHYANPLTTENKLCEAPITIQDAYNKVIATVRKYSRILNDDDSYELHEKLKD